MSASLPPLLSLRRRTAPLHPLLLLFQFLLLLPATVTATTKTTTKKATRSSIEIGIGESIRDISSTIHGLMQLSSMRGRQGSEAVMGGIRRSRRCGACATNNSIGAAFVKIVVPSSSSSSSSSQSNSKTRRTLTHSNMSSILVSSKRTVERKQVALSKTTSSSSSSSSSMKQNPPPSAFSSPHNINTLTLPMSLRGRGQWRRPYCNIYNNVNNFPTYYHSSSFTSSSSALFATVPRIEEALEFSDLDYFSSDSNTIIPTHHEHNHDDNDDTKTSPPSDSNISGGKETGHVVDSNEHANNSESNEVADNYDIEEKEGNKSITSSSSNIIFQGIKSRPNNKEEEKGGEEKDTTPSWNPADPLGWCKTFGSRSQANSDRLAALVKLRPGDEGYFDVSDIDNTIADINDVVTTTVLLTTTSSVIEEQESVAEKDGNTSITIVRTPEQAQIVMKALMEAKAENPQRIYACDTEVMDIDLKEVGPVGNGYVTCLSVYAGPDFDFGLGHGPGSTLWVDNLDDACGVLQEFKAWLEDRDVLKVWHNYGFDRHVIFNEGINVRGFGGDTMHMARLSDTGRMKYSLESLTEDLLKERKVPMKEIFGEARLRKDGSPGALVDIPPVERLQRDPKFRKKFIVYSAKDAKSTYNLYQHLKMTLEKKTWIRDYSLMDYYHLHMRPFGELLTDLERRGILIATDYLADVEVQARKDREGHVDTFRKWAAKQIGPDGLAMNLASSVQLSTFLFGGSKNSKTREVSERVRVFKTPRAEIPDDAMEAYKEREARMKEEKNNEIIINEGQGQQQGEPTVDEFDQMKSNELKVLCKAYGLKVSGKKADLQQRLRGHFLLGSGSPESKSSAVIDDYDAMSKEDLLDLCKVRSVSNIRKQTKASLIKQLREDDSHVRELTAECMQSPTDMDMPITYRKISELLEQAAESGENDALKCILDDIKAKNNEEPKYVDVKITSLGMEPDSFTVSGAPSATSDVLKKLAGDPFSDPPKYGKAYDFFGGGQQGHDACVAFFSLTAVGSIDTMIANFLTSLQTLADDKQRVHGSLNINTETGRLSSRKPNLQNQPALEKDKYKIRKAFIASPGNNLIVADYGQLELRLLASMTDCTSMIEAFEAGGDFHSRTALGMFDYIQDAVANGECLLEWDYANGEPPKPMLKDQYASERRKAKTLNFSIAYGKTAHGLSQDWGVSKDEAEKMLEAWYNSRPEVLKWQEDTRAIAQKHGITRTLMGRYRDIPHAKPGNSMKAKGHALRASINTPIQGGAADVAMMAMLKINNSELLQRLGWILLMQVHDEVILEGPEETAKEAFEEVLKCMQEPWVLGLEKTKVPLLVDGSFCHKNWYDAK